jgi:hypothetical protein
VTWGAGIIRVRINVDIPEWPFWPVIFLVLLYRRVRYGYAFRKIRLNKGKFAIVDADDYHRLNRHNWYAQKSRNCYYARRVVNIGGRRKALPMHREILEVGDNMMVDHINHNGLDNRKSNLRAATAMQNAWNNKRKRGRNKFRGVSWNKVENKWQAQLGHAGQHINVGYFDDEVEAARAYDEAVRRLRGEFAVLNFGRRL